MTDSDALYGEEGGYVPCDDEAAVQVASDADDYAIVGEGEGRVPAGQSALAESADDETAAVAGADVGYVAKPCGEDCGITDTFQRTTGPLSAGTSDSLLPWGLTWPWDPNDPTSPLMSTNGSRLVMTHAVESIDVPAPGDPVAWAGIDTLLTNFPTLPVLDFTVEFQWETAPVAGSTPASTNVLVELDFGHGLSTSSLLICRLPSTGSLWFLKNEDGVESPVVYPASNWSTGLYKIHVVSDATTISANVWPAADPEPASWQATVDQTAGETVPRFALRLIPVTQYPAEGLPAGHRRRTLYWDNLDIVGVNRCTVPCFGLTNPPLNASLGTYYFPPYANLDFPVVYTSGSVATSDVTCVNVSGNPLSGSVGTKLGPVIPGGFVLPSRNDFRVSWTVSLSVDPLPLESRAQIFKGFGPPDSTFSWRFTKSEYFVGSESGFYVIFGESGVWTKYSDDLSGTVTIDNNLACGTIILDGPNCHLEYPTTNWSNVGLFDLNVLPFFGGPATSGLAGVQSIASLTGFTLGCSEREC